MKINQLALIALPIGASAFAPNGATSTSTALHAESKNNNDWMRPVLATFAGLTIASQSAFAVIGDVKMDAQSQQVVEQIVSSPSLESPSMTSSNMMLSAFGAPGSASGNSFETLDFSLPSYTEATKGVAEEKAAPTFDPFGTGGSTTTENVDSEADKAAAKEAEKEAKAKEASEKKAAAEAERQANAERKAKEKADREAEKSSAEAKKIEEKEKAEAAKAEKEARRKAQAELMRQAVERTAEKKVEEEKVSIIAACVPELL